MTDHTVGVDISKRHLDAFQLPEEKAAQFTNDAAGFRKLIAWIGKSIKCVAYEPTGPYHRDFEQALLKAKLPLAKVNPWQARRFAQATGQRAKTDAVDARMLAGMAATLALRPTPLASKRQRALSDLQTGKNKLIRDRTAELNRGDHLRDPLLKQQHQTHLNMLNRHRRAIDTKIQELIAAEPTLVRKAEIIASIPGLASNTAANLLAEMPELGTLPNKAVVSLAGLAPIARESGAWQGRRFIQGGRHPVRRLLYMPAVAAIRCNPDMKQTYRTLAERGKPGKVAVVAIMRKLLVLANVLIKQDRLWTPQRPQAHTKQAIGHSPLPMPSPEYTPPESNRPSTQRTNHTPVPTCPSIPLAAHA